METTSTNTTTPVKFQAIDALSFDQAILQICDLVGPLSPNKTAVLLALLERLELLHAYAHDGRTEDGEWL